MQTLYIIYSKRVRSPEARFKNKENTRPAIHSTTCGDDIFTITWKTQADEIMVSRIHWRQSCASWKPLHHGKQRQEDCRVFLAASHTLGAVTDPILREREWKNRILVSSASMPTDKFSSPAPRHRISVSYFLWLPASPLRLIFCIRWCQTPSEVMQVHSAMA